jgi:hypothetical protein
MRISRGPGTFYGTGIRVMRVHASHTLDARQRGPQPRPRSLWLIRALANGGNERIDFYRSKRDPFVRIGGILNIPFSAVCHSTYETGYLHRVGSPRTHSDVQCKFRSLLKPRVGLRAFITETKELPNPSWRGRCRSGPQAAVCLPVPKRSLKAW